jgi:glycerol-3-phosphate acyltransferase PlsX
MLGVENPRIGLMSIGAEEAKGNEVVKKARDMLREDGKLNFIGNIEGRDILNGVCDVAICEGFVGNVILKLTEGVVDGLFKAIKQELLQKNKLLAMAFKKIMMDIYKKYDYHEYGGALLLGVKGTGVICHGSSKSRTIKNALVAAKQFYSKKINQSIVEQLSQAPVKVDEQ